MCANFTYQWSLRSNVKLEQQLWELYVTALPLCDNSPIIGDIQIVSCLVHYLNILIATFAVRKQHRNAGSSSNVRKQCTIYFMQSHTDIRIAFDVVGQLSAIRQARACCSLAPSGEYFGEGHK